MLGWGELARVGEDGENVKTKQQFYSISCRRYGSCSPNTRIRTTFLQLRMSKMKGIPGIVWVICAVSTVISVSVIGGLWAFKGEIRPVTVAKANEHAEGQLIPRSMSGDKGKYYFLEGKVDGHTVKTLHNASVPAGPDSPAPKLTVRPCLCERSVMAMIQWKMYGLILRLGLILFRDQEKVILPTSYANSGWST